MCLIMMYLLVLVLRRWALKNRVVEKERYRVVREMFSFHWGEFRDKLHPLTLRLKIIY